MAMTKRERAAIASALDRIMAEDGDFAGAIGDLCRLIGRRYPADELTRDLMPVSVAEISARGAQDFGLDLSRLEQPQCIRGGAAA